MSTPSPFAPKGSFLEFVGTREHRRRRFAVFAGLAASVILLSALVFFGCRRHVEKAELTNPSQVAPETLLPTNAPVTVGREGAARVQTPPGLGPVSSATTEIVEAQSARLTPARQILAVPKLTPEPASKAYTVKQGDTFAKVALANGVTIGAIAEANPDADSRQLRVGQVLQIPVVREAPPSPTSHDASAQVSDSPQIYVVKRGDTLSQISNAHGTTVRTIRTINELRTDRITVGQKLKLPAPNSPSQPAIASQNAATNGPASPSVP